MSRPVNWAPLAESDPIPGEPAAIGGEARRLRDMAVEMRSQISRLRSIGDDDNQGLYADTLRTAASDLAGKLDKTVGRYQQVAGELSSWAPELSHAQDESLRALQKAQAAEAARAANTVEVAAPEPSDPPPSPAEQAAERRRQSALDEAAQDLAVARRQLEDAVEHARSHGRRHADRIREAIDDDVADSWWDNVKDWVDTNGGWIKSVADKLSWVATGLAVVALLLPGVNLIWLAAGVTALALAGHSALAASGSGSWADVGLDVFALATLGAGRLAARGLRGLQAAARTAGTRAAGRAAKAAALRSSRAARTAAGQVLSRRGTTAAQRRGARRFIDSAKQDAQEAGTRAARETRDAPLTTATRREVLRAGNDPGAARSYNDITALRTRFPGDEGVAQANRRADLHRNTIRGAFASGLGADVVDKGGSFIDPYNDAKGHFKKEIGSAW